LQPKTWKMTTVRRKSAQSWNLKITSTLRSYFDEEALEGGASTSLQSCWLLDPGSSFLNDPKTPWDVIGGVVDSFLPRHPDQCVQTVM
jgi:hypothetical protein